METGNHSKPATKLMSKVLFDTASLAASRNQEQFGAIFLSNRVKQNNFS